MPASAESFATRRRLFFALWPDEAARQRLSKIARKALKGRGRPIPAEKLHLTLVFLGAVTEEARQCLEAGAGTISGPPFTLVFDRLGFWPRPRVAWSGCERTPEALVSLVESLRACALGCGLKPELRPYRAHLTLVRKASLKAGFSAPHEAVEVAVEAFHLVESRALPQGASYNILRSFPLDAPSPRRA